MTLLSSTSSIVFTPVDSVIDFLAVYWYFLGGFHPQSYLVATYFNDGDYGVVVDYDALIFLSAEY